jgi:hypothetical protein
MPQAIVHVINGGGARSVGRISAQFKYLARRGALQLQFSERHGGGFMPYGEFPQWARLWAGEAGNYVDGRLVGDPAQDMTTHIVVSFPPGTDHDSAHRAGRDWARMIFGSDTDEVIALASEMFGGDDADLDYVTAFHVDREHPHLHVIVNRRALNEDHEWFKLARRNEHINYDIMRTRLVLAAREQGIQLRADARVPSGRDQFLEQVRQAVRVEEHWEDQIEERLQEEVGEPVLHDERVVVFRDPSPTNQASAGEGGSAPPPGGPSGAGDGNTQDDPVRSSPADSAERQQPSALHRAVDNDLFWRRLSRRAFEKWFQNSSNAGRMGGIDFAEALRRWTLANSGGPVSLQTAQLQLVAPARPATEGDPSSSAGSRTQPGPAVPNTPAVHSEQYWRSISRQDMDNWEQDRLHGGRFNDVPQEEAIRQWTRANIDGFRSLQPTQAAGAGGSARDSGIGGSNLTGSGPLRSPQAGAAGSAQGTHTGTGGDSTVHTADDDSDPEGIYNASPRHRPATAPAAGRLQQDDDSDPEGIYNASPRGSPARGAGRSRQDEAQAGERSQRDAIDTEERFWARMPWGDVEHWDENSAPSQVGGIINGSEARRRWMLVHHSDKGAFRHDRAARQVAPSPSGGGSGSQDDITPEQQLLAEAAVHHAGGGDGQNTPRDDLSPGGDAAAIDEQLQREAQEHWAQLPSQPMQLPSQPMQLPEDMPHGGRRGSSPNVYMVGTPGGQNHTGSGGDADDRAAEQHLSSEAAAEARARHRAQRRGDDLERVVQTRGQARAEEARRVEDGPVSGRTRGVKRNNSGEPVAVPTIDAERSGEAARLRDERREESRRAQAAEAEAAPANRIDFAPESAEERENRLAAARAHRRGDDVDRVVQTRAQQAAEAAQRTQDGPVAGRTRGTKRGRDGGGSRE